MCTYIQLRGLYTHSTHSTATNFFPPPLSARQACVYFFSFSKSVCECGFVHSQLRSSRKRTAFSHASYIVGALILIAPPELEQINLLRMAIANLAAPHQRRQQQQNGLKIASKQSFSIPVVQIKQGGFLQALYIFNPFVSYSN